MKDEIKKINITFPGQILDYVDTKEHLLELFNCITNLQEENEEQKNIIVKQNDSIKGAIEYIKECIDSEDIYEQFLSTGETKKLLNILQGEDKDVKDKR